MINTIILGHALNVLPKLPAESVSCCVTSPPYWSLRDYGIEPVIWDGDKDCKHEWGNKNITLKHKSGETNPGKESWFKDRGASDDRGNCFCLRCNAWRGSLGLEPTFELYIKHLCDIFDEVKRVLRKDGTCWVNLGDSYGGSGNASGHTKDTKNLGYKTSEMGATQGNQKATKQYAKSLCLIPQRFAIKMVNRGWILRNTIIWHKANCMPSSAKDRFTVDFEYVYFFTKNKRYWFEQQFEAWTDTNINDTKRAGKYIQYGGRHKDSENNKGIVVGNSKQGRNKRAVWTIPTQPFPEAHFAVYPRELISVPIKAGCPEFICKKCGKARVKVFNIDINEDYVPRKWQKTYKGKVNLGGSPTKRSVSELFKESLSKRKVFKSYTDCGCNAGFAGGIILDPFMGAGTTALVALKQRKRFIGIEIKQEYIEMTKKRIDRVQQELI